MAKYEVLPVIPEEYKKRFLGEGMSAKCYQTIYGDVFKQYFSPYRYENSIKFLSEINSDYFTFPKTLVYLNERSPFNLIGYRMDYVEGKYFNEIDKGTDINVFLKAVSNIEQEIINLSKSHNIKIYDINNRNIFFQNNNEFKIVDTDLYEHWPYREYLNVKHSMMVWNEFLLYSMLCHFNIFESINLNLRFEIAIWSGKLRASQFLEEVISQIRNKTKNDVESLDDYYNGLKLIMRKK